VENLCAGRSASVEVGNYCVERRSFVPKRCNDGARQLRSDCCAQTRRRFLFEGKIAARAQAHRIEGLVMLYRPAGMRREDMSSRGLRLHHIVMHKLLQHDARRDRKKGDGGSYVTRESDHVSCSNIDLPWASCKRSACIWARCILLFSRIVH